MSSEETDLASLTEEQQLALQQYTSVTDQDLAAAIPLLQKCEWNVQIAIARFFDGEPAPIVDDAPDIPPPQATRRRQDTLANDFPSPFSTVSASARRYQPAPRIAAASDSQLHPRPPLLLSLVLTPANLLYSLLTRVFGLFSYLFPFLPRLLTRFDLRPTTSATQPTAGGRRPLGPQDTTARFLREFEEEYGAHALPFLETGYSRAFDLAKRELKFLVTIPLAPEHDDTPPFVRDVLLAHPVQAFLNDPANNLLLWAGSVQDSEAYQVAASLEITRFPTVALIAHTPAVSSTAMSVVARVPAPASPATLLAKLQTSIAEHSPALERARAARAEQDATRTLRDQQNSAYERSLAADRERARRKREADAARASAEAEQRDRAAGAQKRAQDARQWRRWRARRLLPEPGPESGDAVRISLRLPSGERVTRRVPAAAPMEELYALAECWDSMPEAADRAGTEALAEGPPAGYEHAYAFRLVAPLPRRVFALADGGAVGEVLGRSGNLIVERVEEGEEEEGSA